MPHNAEDCLPFRRELCLVNHLERKSQISLPNLTAVRFKGSMALAPPPMRWSAGAVGPGVRLASSAPASGVSRTNTKAAEAESAATNRNAGGKFAAVIAS